MKLVLKPREKAALGMATITVIASMVVKKIVLHFAPVMVCVRPQSEDYRRSLVLDGPRPVCHIQNCDGALALCARGCVCEW